MDSFIDELRSNARKFGVAILHIPRDDEGPGFSYTVGLTAVDHPELLTFSLPLAVAESVLNDLSSEVLAGKPIRPCERRDNLLEGYEITFLPIPDPLDWIMQAQNAYPETRVSALQVVWPDKQHRYPWHDDFAHPQAQPVPGWPFTDAPDTYVFTTRHVTQLGAPLQDFYRDEDGNYEFLSAFGAVEAEAQLVSLYFMFSLDPTISQLATLPPGSSAHRSRPGEPWKAPQ